MNYKNVINAWLDRSIHNQYFFSSDQITNEIGFLGGFKTAIEALRNELSTTWTREEYLAWVKLWKKTYEQLSTDCRLSKVYRKETLAKPPISGINAHNARVLRAYANVLLDLRSWAKDCANEAYAKEHDVKELAAA